MRWNIKKTQWVTGVDWFLVIDSEHEHNSYETPHLHIAQAFQAMMEGLQ